MIAVDRNVMLKAMSLAALGTDVRTTKVPILRSIRVQANGALSLTATDLNMEIEARCAYSGDEAAPFLIEQPGALAHMLRHADGADVAMRPGNGSKEPLGIDAGDIAVEAKPEYHVDDFPVARPITQASFAATLAPAHIDLLRRVAIAMSKEETRYYLNGVYLHRVDEWTVRAVATDGHRLVVASLPLMDCSDALNGVIVPRDAIHVLTGPLAKSDGFAMRIGDVTPRNADSDLAPSTDMTRFEVETTISGVSVRMTSKLIDGAFPDYTRVIPQGEPVSITVDAKALRRAVRALSVSGSRVPVLRLRFHHEGVDVETASSVATLSGRMRVAAEGYPVKGGPRQIEVGFSGQYLTDLMKVFTGDRIVFGLDQESAASAPVSVSDPADSGIFAVQMPLRL
tara:strand:- start:515 stop:1708 length:1194 start_codon:yes stop_codon:yes gene_type:complete